MSMTQSEIELATLRLVPHCLNQLSHRVPQGPVVGCFIFCRLFNDDVTIEYYTTWNDRLIDELQKILDENYFWSYVCFISRYLPAETQRGSEKLYSCQPIYPVRTAGFCEQGNEFNICHIRALNDNTIYTARPTNAGMWNVFIACHSLQTCFDSCRGHHQGNLQNYKESKHTVKMYKWNTHCYKACLSLWL
jgi:hypothetical protein